MSKLLSTFASLIVASIAVGPSAAQQLSSCARSGAPNCTMSPSIGFIIGSHQTVACAVIKAGQHGADWGRC